MPIVRMPPTIITMRAASGCPERPSTAPMRRSPSTMRPMQNAFATVPMPIRAPSAQASTSTTTATAMFAVPNESGVCFGDALVEHVPGRQAELRLEQEHDPEREEEEARDERAATREEVATHEGREEHRSSLRVAPADGVRQAVRRHAARRLASRGVTGAPLSRAHLGYCAHGGDPDIRDRSGRRARNKQDFLQPWHG